MRIDSSFDSGNIEILDLGVEHSAPRIVRLAIRKDETREHYQWFHFRLLGARAQQLELVIENAGGASYPRGWENYRAVISTDGARWLRAATRYVDGQLRIALVPQTDCLSVAYFAPYPLTRHHALLGRIAARSSSELPVALRSLGRTVDGRSLDLLQVGTPGAGRKAIWLVARQHPGETMAEWFMEGFLERLTDPRDALARALRARAVVYAVPNMNPDGSVRGHLRCNAAGANLNREWHAPTPERSPEVLAVRDEMDRTGVDICLDVHGDEGLPYVFCFGARGIPGYSEALAAREDALVAAWMRANPDLQNEHGYPVPAPGKANLTMCSKGVAARFGALSMTVEMPFKDNADAPDEAEGWSAGRSMRLGASLIDALMAVTEH